ncbi:flagellar hook-associated protein 3 [Candidatus Magnetoovum chiemensis]|nr:flagellar hook-associated protein 3 [Candidatus Magnetoovum chiemensis]
MIRISTFMFYDRTRRSFQNNLGKLMSSQEQLSTGLKINRPSDNTIDLGKVLDYKLSISKNDQYKRNIDSAESFIQYSETAMASVTENLQRLQELTIQAVSGQTSPEDREDIGEEVSIIKEALFNLANSKFNGRYIFAGFQLETQPFVASSGSYIYRGDDKYLNVDINQNTQVIENITGSDAFAFSLSSTETIQIYNGKYIHYIPTVASTAITTRISSSSDPNASFDEEFTFSNYIDIVNQMEDAYNTNNVNKLYALMKPIEYANGKVTGMRAELGARLNYLDRERNSNEDISLYLEGLRSDTEDVDMTEAVTDVAKAELALQALRQTASQILTQSLLDFID